MMTFIPAAPASAATSPGQWAGKFCPAFSNWSTTTTAEQTAFQQSVATSLQDGTFSVPAMKAKLVNFFDTGAADTAAVIASIRNAGAPSSTNGTKIQATFLKTFALIRDQSLSAEKKATNLNAADPAQFVTQMGALLTHYENSGGDFRKAFGSINKLDVGGKLGRALSTNSVCTAMESP